MKKLILAVLVLFLASFTNANIGLTNTERQAALEHLQKTQEHLFATVDGLSEVQLNFKGSPNSWSIAECLEHLVVSEDSFGEMLRSALKTPADPAKRSEVKMADEQLTSLIANRENKVKTSEAFEPTGQFGSFEETLRLFKEKRAAHIEYLKNTEDDLRNHYGELPYGTIDGLQILLSMSGHTERHVKQMEEVMANAAFPGK